MRSSIRTLVAAAVAAASVTAVTSPGVAGVMPAPAVADSAALTLVRDHHRRPHVYRHHYRPHHRYRPYHYGPNFWFGFPFPPRPYYCHQWYRAWDGRLYCRY
jgi:hypothetical protein